MKLTNKEILSYMKDNGFTMRYFENSYTLCYKGTSIMETVNMDINFIYGFMCGFVRCNRMYRANSPLFNEENKNRNPFEHLNTSEKAKVLYTMYSLILKACNNKNIKMYEYIRCSAEDSMYNMTQYMHNPDPEDDKHISFYESDVYKLAEQADLEWLLYT